jgi:hypothetical protein
VFVRRENRGSEGFDLQHSRRYGGRAVQDRNRHQARRHARRNLVIDLPGETYKSGASDTFPPLSVNCTWAPCSVVGSGSCVAAARTRRERAVAVTGHQFARRAGPSVRSGRRCRHGT